MGLFMKDDPGHLSYHCVKPVRSRRGGCQSGIRNAKVKAFALCDDEVQFVTGINYQEGQKLVIQDNYIAVWGLHPEDVASEKLEIGAAILFDPEDFVENKDDGTQKLLISGPTKQLECWISSATAKESEINTLEAFVEFIENLSFLSSRLNQSLQK
jgi:hypothetical protein